MSRSRKKEPFVKNTCSGANRGEKKDKRLANRKHRRVNRVRLGNDEDMVSMKEVSNVWDFAGDGKSRFNPEEDAYFKKLMRK